MNLSDHIQKARHVLNHERTPEGSLLLNRDGAIDLLVFLQNVQETAKYLEMSLESTREKKENYGLADMDGALPKNNVVCLFPETTNSTTTPDLSA